MKRKLLGLLFTMAMVMSLLVGCAEGANESTNDVVSESADGGNNAVVNQDTGSSEKETGVENTVETKEDDNNTTVKSYPTLSLCWDEELKQSAVVSYDSEKVELIDLNKNAAKFQWLDKKDVTLLLMCEDGNSSVEDLYQKEMKSLESDGLSVSELTEKEVGYYTVLRGDGVWNSDGTVGFEFFALKLENGIILYAVHLPGFENQVYLDEMLPYVLAYATAGDGTRMIPASFEFPDEGADTSSEAEWDTFFEVTSLGGVKVKVYYAPDVVVGHYTFEPEFFLADADGNEYTFAIADFATAEARRQGKENELNSQKMLEDVYVSELQESQAGEYIIQSYSADYMVYSYDGSGELSQGSTFREAVIELGSGVVCVFNDEYLDEPGFGQFLLGMKIVVE